MMKRRPYRNLWGKNRIGEGTETGAYVEIGDGVVIGKDCLIEAFVFIPPGVEIGNNVFVGPHTCFTNHKHPRIMGLKFTPERTVVEDGVVIGANCTILPGIVLGKGCTIGAGSVVVKSVPRGATVYGNPAQVRYRQEQFAHR